ITVARRDDIRDAAELEKDINRLWETRDTLTPEEKAAGEKTVSAVLDTLGSGMHRICEKKDGTWHVNQWLKKAVLLSFRMNDNVVMAGGPNGTSWFDKVGMKFANMTEEDF